MTKTITRKVNETTTSVSNDLATLDAHAQTPDVKDETAQQAFVSKRQWDAFLKTTGGVKAYASQLDRAAKEYDVKSSQVRLAMVLMAARLFKSDPSQFSKGAGNVNASALAKALGVEKRGNWRTSISKGVPALLSAGADLYGEPSPEVVALALAYQKTEKANYAKSAKGAKTEGEKTEESAKDDVVESRPLKVSDLVEALQTAKKIMDGLQPDLADDEWATVEALLIDMQDAVTDPA